MRSNGLRMLLLLALLPGAGCAPPAAEERVDYECPDCNVILVSIDTLRADHLGCYGYERSTSPRVDHFSGSSVLFRNAMAHAPSTEPSHASIFTSLLPVHHGALRARHLPIAESVKTMAEILREAGLRTVSFNGGGQVAASYGFDRGFETYQSSTSPFSGKVGDALRWLDENGDEQFFMFLHTYEVHAPYTPLPRYMNLFDADYTGPLDDGIAPRLLIEINDGTRSIDEADAQHIVNAYDAEILSMDGAFGRLISELAQRELLDETLVIFTSDHGEEFGEHAQTGRHSHSLYDELLHVPLIVRMPGARFANTVVQPQVRGIDILPTVVDVLGLDRLEQFDGTSLTGLMMGRPEEPRLTVSQVDTADPSPPTSIRSDSRKLIVPPQAILERRPYRWYADRAEIVSRSHELSLFVEAFHRPRPVRISVDGEVVKEAVIGLRKHPLGVPFRTAEERIVTIEAVEPCTRPEEVGARLDVPCASFRVFGRNEYYLLDDDPKEQNNRFYEASHRDDIARLRRQLEEILASHEAPAEKKVGVDAETRERLRALGYVD